MTPPTRITYHSFSPHPYFSRFHFLLDHYQPGLILDLGNIGGIQGHGQSFSSHQSFRTHLSPSDHLVGLDLFLPKSPKNYPHQIQADINSPLPFHRHTFDTIYMGEILEHLLYPTLVLTDIHRILKPTGTLIIDTPNPFGLNYLGKYLVNRLEDLGDPTHHLMFTPGSLVSLLNHTSFTITSLSCKHPPWHRHLPRKLITGLGTHLLVSCHKTFA